MAMEVRKYTGEACYFEGCGREARSKGLCNRHYERLRVNGTLELKQLHEDLAGSAFGRLTAIHIVSKKPKTQWHCICTCGQEVDVAAGNLKSGHTTSCGCIKKISPNRRTHGMTSTGTYRSWVAMRRRCTDQDYVEWHLYGGRGIRVCDHWMGSFVNFLADMGERPDGTSLDRKNPDGDYTPENCRWATAEVQASNRRNNLYGEIGFDKRCHAAGLSPNTVRTRMSRQGMSFEEALSAPVKYARRPNV